MKLTMERAAVRRRPLMAISDSAYVTGLQRLECALEDRAELQVRSDLDCRCLWRFQRSQQQVC